MASFARFFFENPFLKAFVLGVIGLAGNALSGAYIFQITKSDGNGGQFIDWWASFQNRLFYILIFLAFFGAWYIWKGARSEQAVRGKLLVDEVKQSVVNRLVAHLTEQTARKIDGGEITNLQDAMDKFNLRDEP
jgi:hypothetical protein